MTGVAWTKKPGGSARPGGEGGGLLESWAIPELQATIACVGIVLKAWRPGLWIVVLGPQFSLSKLFPFLWLVRSLCSWGEGQFEKKEGGRKTWPWHRSCVTSPTCHRPSIFFCFMSSWQPRASRADLKTGNASEFTSPLILAMGSWPENTSSNFCLYWSSCVFPLMLLSPVILRLFFVVVFFATHSPQLIQKSLFQFVVYSVYITYILIQKDSLSCAKEPPQI